MFHLASSVQEKREWGWMGSSKVRIEADQGGRQGDNFLLTMLGISPEIMIIEFWLLCGLHLLVLIPAPSTFCCQIDQKFPLDAECLKLC